MSQTPFADARHHHPNHDSADHRTADGQFSHVLRARAGHAGHADRPLLQQTSEPPGPKYPFPSQQTAHAVQPGGFLRSVVKPFRRARLRVQSYTFLDWLQVFLPCVKWLRSYRIREYLLWDIIAGISVGFMVVPQGMSYANIAGVPSVYGLYGAFLPVLVYAFFGSSKELAVGPVAVTSLLISSSLKEVVPGSADITNPNNPPAELVPVQQMYNHRAIQLSLLVACMYTAVGVFNLGFLTNFLSHSVIGGFTSGAAIIIGMSQLKFLLGYNVPRADKLYEQIHLYIEGIDGFVWQEYVMGVTLLTMLLTIKFFGKRSPRLKWLRPLGPICACVVAIVAVVAGNLQDKGIKIVGHIPAGLPSPTVSWWLPMEDAARLAPLALVVMVVDLLESTSIARALAAKCKYELNANQEIVGLGLANFAGSAFNAYSTTGSFSRSAVNYDSGAKTGLSGFVTGCVVGLVLLVMTPVFEKLPLNVMGAIVISGVSGLFEYEEAVHLFKVRKLDWCVWMCSFISTMFLGVEIGLAISIGLALLIVIYETAFPHTALLGRVGRTTIYRNVKQFPDSQVIPGIAACRVDAAMYFANVAYIHERLRKYVSRAEAYSEAAGTRLQYVLLDMSPVTHLDSTGASLLEKVYNELQQQDVQLALCNPACGVVALLERSGFFHLLGREWVFVRMHDAVQTCLAAMISDGQAVRPLSAYDSQALSPRTTTGLPGPRPLLFHPPGRHSPEPLPRRSAPGAGPRSGGPGDPLLPQLNIFQQGRRSLDGGGSGSSPLLPRKYGGGGGAGGGFSPRSSGWGLGGALYSPRIGTGDAAAATNGVVGAPGCSASGGGSSSTGSSRMRPESAPGFHYSAGGAGHDEQPPASLAHHHHQQQHHSTWQMLQHQQQQHQLQHAGADPQESALWAANAVAAAAANGSLNPSLQPQHGTSIATAGTQAAATLAPLSGAGLPGPPPPPLLVRAGSSQVRSTDGSYPGGPRSTSSMGAGAAPLPPAVALGGLHLHISPTVLAHPAVLSRSQSLAGDAGAGPALLGPLSSSSSFRRPVSPRTERLLDEVFSASNGDDFLAADASGGGSSQGAMLQMSEICSDEPAPAAGQGPSQGGGYHPAAAAGGAVSVLIGSDGGHGEDSPAAAAAQATGEVRLLLGATNSSHEH